MSALELRMVNEYQRDFPLCSAPFAQVARSIGMDEDWVLQTTDALIRRGVVSRVGAVFAPHAVGGSTLAALEVPPERLPEVAALVSSYPEVNHNYQRQHRINLWFVVTAVDRNQVEGVLAKIEQRANCGPVVRCPLVEEYRIDLGFDLVGGWTNRDAAPTFVDRSLELSQDERHVVGVLQSGLPILAHPYAVLAERAGLTEEALIRRLKGWVERGVIRRFGFVARHHELGFQANAMVVWNVPDVMTRSFGSRLAREEGVTLCYRRSSSPPRWPYNLYCMVHGRDKEMTERQIERITESAGLGAFARDVLFGVTRFKQRGARYLNEYTGEPAHA